MKTDQLIDLLAADAVPVPPQAASRRMGLALLLGLPLAVLIVALEYGFRRDLAAVSALPMFWMKLGLPLVVAVAGFVVASRLGRPGVRAGLPVMGFIAPLLLAWGLGLFVWLDAPASGRDALLWGQTWRSCAFSIGLIALPAFVAAMVALRSLAPTRPAAAGAAAGAFAGGLGAAVYALHCPELAAPFIAVWYVLGVTLPVALGAVCGRLFLRW